MAAASWSVKTLVAAATTRGNTVYLVQRMLAAKTHSCKRSLRHKYLVKSLVSVCKVYIYIYYKCSVSDIHLYIIYVSISSSSSPPPPPPPPQSVSKLMVAKQYLESKLTELERLREAVDTQPVDEK